MRRYCDMASKVVCKRSDEFDWCRAPFVHSIRQYPQYLQPHFAAYIESTYTAIVKHSIRNVLAEDLDAVLELNESVVPAVNSVTIEKMHWFSKRAEYFRVATVEDRLAAFLIGLRPGTDYESLNYRWFCDRYDDFAYVDRIAVGGHARRYGLASALYEDFRSSVPSSVGVMTCEVNIRPPNPASMRFHERQGFSQVASLASEDGSKAVALMAKKL